mgnify:CR=1 FL=1
MLGGQLGQMAVRNGWVGILLYGCVRDATELASLDQGFRTGPDPDHFG